MELRKVHWVIVALIAILFIQVATGAYFYLLFRRFGCKTRKKGQGIVINDGGGLQPLIAYTVSVTKISIVKDDDGLDVLRISLDPVSKESFDNASFCDDAQRGIITHALLPEMGLFRVLNAGINTVYLGLVRNVVPPISYSISMKNSEDFAIMMIIGYYVTI